MKSLAHELWIKKRIQLNLLTFFFYNRYGHFLHNTYLKLNFLIIKYKSVILL